jgi:uncharacterized membrane protein
MAGSPFDDELKDLQATCDWLEAQLHEVRGRLRGLELRGKAAGSSVPLATAVPPAPTPETPASPNLEYLARLEPPAAPPAHAKAPAISTPPPVAAPEIKPQPPRPPASVLEDLAKRATPPTAAPKTSPPAPKLNVELLLGRTWLNRIGAIILLMAIAFFVKYAFDQGWLSPTARVILAAITGLLLVGGGEYSLHRGMRIFAGGLIGCGVGVLYLACFAAHNFYHLVDTSAASVLYTLVTALSIVASVHGHLLPVAILAVLGGFGTPIALSTGVDKQVALLTYVIALDVGFLASAAIRKWDVLRILSWLGTAALFVGWYLDFYKEPAMWRTAGFILVFYILFHGEGLLSLWRGQTQWPRVMAWLLHADNAVFFAASYFLLCDAVPKWMGLFTVITAAVQWLAAWRLRGREEIIRPAIESLWLDGAAILAFAAPIQFDRYLVSVNWAIQGAVTFWFCRRTPRIVLRAKALGVLIAAVVHLWMYDRADGDLTQHFWIAGHWFATRLLLCMAWVSICTYAAAIFLVLRRKASLEDTALAVLLLIIGTAQLLATFADHWERYLATWWWLGLAAGWWLLASRSRWAVIASFSILLATGLKLFNWDTTVSAVENIWSELHGVILNRAVITGVLVAAAATAFRLHLPRLPSKVCDNLGFLPLPLLTCLGALAITWTGTFEVLRVFRFEAWATRTFSQPQEAQGLFLTGFWLLNAAALWLIIRPRMSTLAHYALVLTLLAVFKMLLTDTLLFAFRGPWDHLSGICFNRVCIVGAICIATGFLCSWRVRQVVASARSWAFTPETTILTLLLAILSVTWIPSFEIARVFHFEPLRLRFSDPRLAMHVAFSVFWATNATVLLVIGFARWVPAMRYYALLLFAVTIVKVLAFDLAHQAMIYRIISFVVLGVLLLLASFLYQRVSARFAPPATQSPPPAD